MRVDEEDTCRCAGAEKRLSVCEVSVCVCVCAIRACDAIEKSTTHDRSFKRAHVAHGTEPPSQSLSGIFTNRIESSFACVRVCVWRHREPHLNSLHAQKNQVNLHIHTHTCACLQMFGGVTDTTLILHDTHTRTHTHTNQHV